MLHKSVGPAIVGRMLAAVLTIHSSRPHAPVLPSTRLSFLPSLHSQQPPAADTNTTAMIPRILWHMGGGILKRKLNKPVPGALLHYPGVWKSRAGLWDCHFGPKLTENAYFRNMELAIWYGCGLQGILHACAKKRWYFVFGSQGIRHYKDIHVGQPYEVHTQNIYWDDTWFFLLAQFKCPDTEEVFAEGLSRVMLRHGREPVDSRLLYEMMGVHDIPDKEHVPNVVQQFLEWDKVSEKSMKSTSELNAMLYANNARPALLSAHSMNLPFSSSQVKEETL